MEKETQAIAQIFAKACEIGPAGLQRLIDAIDTIAEPAAQTIDQFARDVNLSRSTVYKEIAARRLRTFLVGTSRRISREARQEYICRLEEATARAEVT